VALVLLLAPLAATSGNVVVYKYRTADGKVDYGTEVPPGATLLSEVGSMEKPGALDESGAKAAPIAARLGKLSDAEAVLTSLVGRPLTSACFAVGVFLWAALTLRLFPPLFRTRRLDFSDAAGLVVRIALGVAILAVLGYCAEWLWITLGVSPRAMLGDAGADAIGWALYGLVAVLALRRRLGVGVVQATIFAALWFAVVAGSAAAVWVYFLAGAAATS